MEKPPELLRGHTQFWHQILQFGRSLLGLSGKQGDQGASGSTGDFLNPEIHHVCMFCRRYQLLMHGFLPKVVFLRSKHVETRLTEDLKDLGGFKTRCSHPQYYQYSSYPPLLFSTTNSWMNLHWGHTLNTLIYILILFYYSCCY